MKAEEFDQAFDSGEDSAAPGVTRQSIIKVWIAEHLERGDPAAA